MQTTTEKAFQTPRLHNCSSIKRHSDSPCCIALQLFYAHCMFNKENEKNDWWYTQHNSKNSSSHRSELLSVRAKTAKLIVFVSQMLKGMLLTQWSCFKCFQCRNEPDKSHTFNLWWSQQTCQSREKNNLVQVMTKRLSRMPMGQICE